MSNAIYPALQGETYPIVRTPMHSTLLQTSASGLEVRVPLYNYPRYQWQIPYSYLDDSAAFQHFQTIIGFFNSRHGRYDSFLLNDVKDNLTMGSQFGTGDGVTVAFQIGRQLGTGFDPIYDLNVSPALKVYIGSVLTAAYTINATGLITFSAAPGGGAVLTADFGYYWRVRFADDTLDFEQFVQTLWELKKVSLIQVRA